MPAPTVGAIVPTRAAGDAMITDAHAWPLRNGDDIRLFSGVILATGALVHWSEQGERYVGCQDAEDILTSASGA